MKRKISTLFFLLSITLNISAQKLSFKADIDMMSPVSYPTKTGLTDFSFEMKNDSAFVYLPYMGNVYNPSFNNDGLNFNEPCQNLKVTTRKKKDGQDISFFLKHDNIRYDFNITLFDNGGISINMQPSNAQSCSYSGQCDESAITKTKTKTKTKTADRSGKAKSKKDGTSKKSKFSMYVGYGIGI